MMTTMIGNHSKFNARAADRDRVREFYGDVVGCTITKQSKEVDYFRLGDDFFIAALYDGRHALAEDDAVKATWFEIKTNDPDGLVARIRAFGATELETWDKDHVYVQAPGGQVFRVVGVDEDLARFES
jgi:extradiol dioxygenase family protein